VTTVSLAAQQPCSSAALPPRNREKERNRKREKNRKNKSKDTKSHQPFRATGGLEVHPGIMKSRNLEYYKPTSKEGFTPP